MFLILILYYPGWAGRYFEISWLSDQAVFNQYMDWDSIQFVLIVLCTGLYLIARVYLLFAIFYGLRSMPSGAYDMVEWTTYLPSFG
jgi:hypothetical protein